MRLLRGMKAALVDAIRRAGYEIVPRASAATMEAALERLAPSVDVRTVIDVGASDGRWSLAATRHFPGARFLLVEAQEAEQGFRCAGLADPMWRPGDSFLWQMDLFFVPDTRPEFASNEYEDDGAR